MRSGILSDEYTKQHFAAFFERPFPKGITNDARHKRVQRPGIPYYDLYQEAQITMDNPYERASEMVERYVAPVEPVNVPAEVVPDTPKTTIFEMSVDEMQNLMGNNEISPPHQPDFGNPFAVYGDQLASDFISQYGTMQNVMSSSPLYEPAQEYPPRSLPSLRENSAYNAHGMK